MLHWSSSNINVPSPFFSRILPMKIQMKEWLNLRILENYHFIDLIHLSRILHNIVLNKPMNSLMKRTVIKLMIKQIVRVKVPFINLLCHGVSPEHHAGAVFAHQFVYFNWESDANRGCVSLCFVIALGRKLFFFFRFVFLKFLEKARVRSRDQDRSRAWCNLMFWFFYKLRLN